MFFAHHHVRFGIAFRSFVGFASPHSLTEHASVIHRRPRRHNPVQEKPQDWKRRQSCKIPSDVCHVSSKIRRAGCISPSLTHPATPRRRPKYNYRTLMSIFKIHLLSNFRKTISGKQREQTQGSSRTFAVGQNAFYLLGFAIDEL